MKITRWLRNVPIDEVRAPKIGRYEVDTVQPHRRSSGFANREREYSVSLSVGGVSGISIPWEGTSLEDARDSFFEYLNNHEEFGLNPTEPARYFRSVHANFNGKQVLFTFRTSWITGFTIG